MKRGNSIYFRLFYVIIFNGVLTVTYGQQLAFPGAEGFGKYTSGGRGGEVIEVTNLNDSGPGSLRAAIVQNGPRTVVFKVSGTIFLRSRLKIENGDITIAGQTAPGDGITLANYNLSISTDNVIIRYIRSRMGDAENQEADAISCTGNSDIIIDHCSFSWGIDEVASCYENENFTMQWCIISESLYNSVHSKEEHGYGGIWGGNRATFHHNLLAHHSSRNPRFNGAREKFSPWEELTDHRNNVIYNWGFNSAYGGEPSEIDGIKASVNIVKNYYKSGPATSSGEKQYRILEPYDHPVYGYSYWYIDSNYVEGYPSVTEDNWLYGVHGVSESEKEEMKSLTPFEFDITTRHTAVEAYIAVLENAGAILPRRDTIDRRIVWEVSNDTASYGGIWGINTGIIDSQEDAGGWPLLFTGPAPADSDHDGMPDEWELTNDLNPYNKNDRNGDEDSDGYTNLEEYLAEIIEYRDFIYPPTDFAVELIDIDNIMLSWTDNSDIEEGYYIERKENGIFDIIDTLPENSVSCFDTGLNYLTEYAYRIRAYNLSDTSIFSDTLSAITHSDTSPPIPSDKPVPADSSEFVRTSAILSWKKGVGSTTHKMYLSQNNPPDLVAVLSDNTFKPYVLYPGATYYWRVDETNDYGTTEGAVWSFTTRSDLPEQLTGHWQFESTTSAVDASEFSNHGEYYHFNSGSFIAEGPINKALYFNGINQYVRIPHSFEFDFENGDFSVAFWLKQDSTQLDTDKRYTYLIKGSHIDDPGKERSGKRYEVYYDSSGYNLIFEVDDNMRTSRVEADKEIYINDDWVHMVATRNTESKIISLYANGNYIVSAEDSTNDISQDEDLYFGYGVDNDMYFIGVLDDVRLYNYVLSDNEIDSLYQLRFVVKNNFAYDNNNITWNIYPNPASNILYLNYDLDENTGFVIKIYSLSGQILHIIRNNDLFMSGILEIDIGDLKPGIYFVQLISEKDIFTKRICINN